MKRLLLLLTLGMLPVMASAQGMFPRNLSLSSSTALTTTHQDRLLLLDCTGGKTFTLPDATTYGVVGDASSSHMFVMKRTSATGTCTIATTSSQTIDGAAPPSLTVQNQELWVVSVGTSDWRTIAKVREACADLADAGTGCTSTATSGTVTSVATAGVVTGGTITNTGTIGILNQGSTTTVLHGNAAGQAAFSATVSADLNITTTSCTNQFVTAISAGAVGTCTTDVLASAQHANQGTTTTVLHGNASGNPSFAGISLANDSTANQGTTTTVLHGNAAGQPSFGAVANADLTNASTTVNSQTCTLGSSCTITATPTAFPSATTGEPLTTNSSGTLVQDSAYFFVDQFAGADIGAQVNACIAALPTNAAAYKYGTCVLPPSDGATLTTTIAITSPYVSLVGSVIAASTFSHFITGDAIRWNTSPWDGNHNAGRLANFTILGDTTANNVCIHLGDIIAPRVENVSCSGFAGTNGAGLWFDNRTNFTERVVLDNYWGNNNTSCMRFTDNNGGTVVNGDYSSFSGLNMQCNLYTGQNAVQIEGDAYIFTQKTFNLNVNVNAGSGAVVRMVANAQGNPRFFSGGYFIYAENDGVGTPTCVTADANAIFEGTGWLNCVGMSNTGAGTIQAGSGTKSFNTDNASFFNAWGPISSNDSLQFGSGANTVGNVKFAHNGGQTVAGVGDSLYNCGGYGVAFNCTMDTSGNAGFGGAVSAVSGFRVNGSATSGNILQGNGTNFVSTTPVTQAAGDNTTALATTAFVTTAISNATAGFTTPLAPAGFPAIRTQSGASLVNDSLLASDATSALLPPCSVLRRSRCRTRTF